MDVKIIEVSQQIAKFDESVREYIELAVAENTRRAIQNDMAHFTAWGGTIPCTPETLAGYIAAHAGVLSVATLCRRIASISKMHKIKGLPSPAASEIVKMTLRGIKRQHGKPQKQAMPILRDDLLLVLASIPDDLRGARDKALLLTGFCGALRRSELCSIRHEDLQFTSEGLLLTLPRSKTDQEGDGRKIGIPFGRGGRVCPVRTLQDWLARSGIASGFVFRAIEKGTVAETALCHRTINNVIKTRVAAAGLSPEKFSGHSLRSGLCTSAAQNGVSPFKIREQTGHKSDIMLSRYIRDGNIFRGNASDLF